jgi:hypothetical protein
MCKPKGNMAKGHVFNEALVLCIEYLESFHATRRHVWDVNEEGVDGEVLEGVSKP